jgi:two-component system, NtrC family, sensor histidine kinase AtoS
MRESKIPRREPPLVSLRGITISYGPVQALKGVDFDVARGEIHGLVGEHRAGKSSLVKLLSGAVTKESGKIFFKGKEVDGFTPKRAIAAGIAIVYQNTNVIPSISAVENIFAGRRVTNKFGFVDNRAMMKGAESLFRKLKLDIECRAPLEDLTEAEQLMVEIAKAISIDPKLIIFDEISNKLTPSEMETVYRILFEFKRRNRSVIYISHNMDEIFQFADRVTILRDGFRQGTEEIQDLDKMKLIRMTYSYVLSREELEQNNRALFVLKKYNEAIIRNLPIGVIIIDQHEAISIINLAAIKILNVPNEPISNLPIDTLFRRCGMEKTEEIVAKIAGAEEYKWEELRCSQGALIRLKVFPFRDDEYDQLGTIVIIEDIAKDRYFQDYLLRSEKIASIAELATGVAHEIRNPLSVVSNYVNLLKRHHRNDKDTDRLTKIEKELNRISDIIGSLLSFSRVKKIPMTPVVLEDLIGEVVLLVDHLITKKAISLRLPTDYRGIRVLGDENSLKQVFVNLVINSIEAVLERGEIEIRVEHDQRSDSVDVSVIDDGCGIPPENADRVFDPFFSTKVGSKNTGLGLSVCQHIIESHEGLIVCTPDDRTIMSVRLPVYDVVGAEERVEELGADQRHSATPGMR